MRLQALAWMVAMQVACAASQDTARSPPGLRAVDPAPPPAAGATSAPTDVLLTGEQARVYMVKLINRDRASQGLAPVELDGGAPTRAGQAHADDMAAHGYLGHWGSDGSVPEQRFTEAGGADMVLENASCFTDERTRSLDPSARVEPKNVELAEDMFFHEMPPNDGHRQNILKPWHRKVGIGVAQPVGTRTEIPVPCFAQEFVDSFGTYLPTPKEMRVGQTLSVAGKIAQPAALAGVGLARVDAPRPVAVGDLNRRRTYPVPVPYQMYWPPNYKTPIPVRVIDDHFSIELPVSDRGRPGLYELSVWATMPGSPEPVMVSLRTIRVR